MLCWKEQNWHSIGMLDLPEVDRLVADAATKTLEGVDIRGIRSERTIDSVGSEALQIYIVTSPDADISLLSKRALTYIHFVQQALLQAGEERFPIIGFAAEDERDQDDDA